MRVAAVDIGTNTVRLLLADVVGDPGHLRVEDVARHEIVTKLGEGLDATGRLGLEPMGRALAGLGYYAGLIDGFGATHVGGVATAATRSAANGDEFISQAAEVLGFDPRIIDGVEEARLTFAGATNALDPVGSYGVVDVGGGSTEFVIGRDRPEYAISIDIGSVRLTERIQQLAIEGLAAQRRYVDSLLVGVTPPHTPATLLGSGGTFVTLAAVHGNLPKDEVEQSEYPALTVGELAATVEHLQQMSVADIANLPGVVPGRAGVLKAGAICAERAVAHLGASEVAISVSDILDGLALYLVEANLAS